MSLLHINMFGGRVPKLAPRLLPDAAAQQAMNTRLTSGELRPWWQPKLIATLPVERAKSVYAYTYNGGTKFLAFTRPTSVAESALINDAHDRIYYTNRLGFFVTTKEDIENNIPASRVGIPAPKIPGISIAPSGGAEAFIETRVYVFTLVSKYGEESGPSSPVVVNGSSSGLWRVRGLDTLTYNSTLYPNVVNLRMYRTITSNGGVDYRLAGEYTVDALPAEFVDGTASTDLASAPALRTLFWALPPEGVQGLIAMSGGFNAAFKGRTVYFSEPYYPHAWPEEYQLAVEDDIVALGFFDNTLVIATKGRVAVAVGTTPAAMSLVTDGKVAPCLSAESLAMTSGAVLYASEEGLVSVSSAGVDVVTKAYMTRDEWMRLSPQTIKGAIYENRYIGFYSSSMGFAFQFDDPMTAWTDVQHPGVTAVVTDSTTSRTLLLRGSDVLEWEGDRDNPMTYIWRSKPAQMMKPENLGVLQVRGAFHTVAESRPDVYRVVEATIDDPLGPNTGALNSGEPIAGPVDADTDDPAFSGVLVRVIADRLVRWEGMVRGEDPVRLPSGYKAHEYEVEVVGSIPVYSVSVASTGKALEQGP